ncbi:anti-sigma factor domain-containing protein [Nesterenkonia sp. HG001]|uniref:anti-sigma factor domain-containing protein n=1 Tax=Nesterenkonia sp. HG001 TaxID=2983207 RepID=UPI002AC72B46|nr:anti-sigma factor [Nesterenkonia sp. HG001]MDZ5076269.1 anti-sigma factor [Nesterenkonia sp. HG001]
METASPRRDGDQPHPEDQEASGASGTPIDTDERASSPDPVQPPEAAQDQPEDPIWGETEEGTATPVLSEDPTLGELLTATAHGDQASFAAFYEATADVVYGLALLMHEDPDGADASTVAVYHHLWDQADVRARDLRLQTAASEMLTDEHADAEASYRPSEYELVLEWLVPLAHRIMVERFRDGSAAPIGLTALPDGPGVAGLPEEVLGDFEVLSDSQSQALALSYLAGATHQQVAQTAGAAIPAVKSRLRDGMTRLHSQRVARDEEFDPILRAAVTRRDLERGTGVNRNFTREVSADLQKGLLVELAEVYALDALDDRERSLLDEFVLDADERTAQQWDTRVLAARRTLAEIFTAHPVVPPAHLLEEVLLDLGDQEVGMGMVEEFSSHTEEAPKREPIMKRWMVVTGFVVVLLLAIVLIWRFTGGQDIIAAADGAEDARELEGLELEEGGTARAVFSETEDVGYVDFEDVGALDGLTYQVWLLPSDERPPSSLGSFTAGELEDEVVTLRSISGYDQLLVTTEQVRGEERPTGEVIVEVPLRDRLTEGPQYGGGGSAPTEDDAEDEDVTEPED